MPPPRDVLIFRRCRLPLCAADAADAIADDGCFRDKQQRARHYAPSAAEECAARYVLLLITAAAATAAAMIAAAFLLPFTMMLFFDAIAAFAAMPR
jgi:hypothetical protein